MRFERSEGRITVLVVRHGHAVGEMKWRKSNREEYCYVCMIPGGEGQMLSYVKLSGSCCVESVP